MATPIQGVPPTAQPWARGIEADLKEAKRKLGILDKANAAGPGLDQAVFYETATAQNIGPAESGKVDPTNPVAVRYVTSTGLFEVTVSLSGLVRDGATLAAGFESEEFPFEVKYDLPKYATTFSAPIGQTAWSPFSQSYSTVLSTRPGVKDLSLYFYAVCTAGPNSFAFVHRALLSVRPV